MPKFFDLTGQRFYRLTVVSRHPDNTLNGIPRWNCLCDCGKGTVVQGGHLKNGHTRSCGCLRVDVTSSHQMSRTPEHIAWSNIKQRCLNPNDSGHDNYGGRGITMCDRWRDSFENFYADMGPRPSDTHSIERRDVNGNYDPENCYWATAIEQANNKRNNVYHEFEGVRYTETELCRKLNITVQSLRYYLNQGLDVKTAVEKSTTTAAVYTYSNQTKTLSEWSVITGISYSKLYNRVIVRGWDIKTAIEKL